MRIVFLKMADEKGVTSKSIAALKKKYPEYRSSGLSSWVSRASWKEWWTNDNKVTEVNMIPLYQEWMSARISLGFLDKMVEVAQACRTADKVMLGIHGEPGDTTCGHIDLFGVKRTVTFGQLAQFILLFLPITATPLKLALIMCFGARSSDARINHTGALTSAEVKSSFAYKFFKRLVQHQDIVMTARTGAVSFSDNDGRSMVQTEAAVGAQLDYDDMQRNPQILQAEALYERLLEQTLARGGRAGMRELRLREGAIETQLNAGRRDWSMLSGIDVIMLNHLIIEKEGQRLKAAQDVEQPKYGKFVYRYDRPHARATVTRKYPNPAVLYSGAL